MPIFTVILIAISLSMDAFSLSLAYGTLNIPYKKMYELSIIVGFFHFIMPIIGNYMGIKIINLLNISPNYVIAIVLIFIGIEMLIDCKRDDKKLSILDLKGLLLFGFAVSLDSFTVGLGLENIYKYPIISCLIFSVFSALFTYLGLKLGKVISDEIGKKSIKIGGITLIFIGIMYFI